MLSDLVTLSVNFNVTLREGSSGKRWNDNFICLITLLCSNSRHRELIDISLALATLRS